MPPADDTFVPFYCGGEPSFDFIRDASSGSDHRDIVGDATFPALLHSADETYVYLWHVQVADSTFNTDADDFLTVAVERAALEAAGISTTAPIIIWAGTSNHAHALDGDGLSGQRSWPGG